MLLPEKAALWPTTRLLMVADLHLAKGATMRAGGIPVPAGSSLRTLDRLSQLIERYAPREVLILGDLFHGREAGLPENIRLLTCWLDLVKIPVRLVAGNHDRWVKTEGLNLNSVPETQIGSFRLTHHPVESESPVISGHIHPGFILTGRGRGSEKLPCFWVQPRQIVLPAFGELTGLYSIAPQPGDRVFVPAGNQVLEVPLR